MIYLDGEPDKKGREQWNNVFPFTTKEAQLITAESQSKIKVISTI